jgi:hypothetical protein
MLRILWLGNQMKGWRCPSQQHIGGMTGSKPVGPIYPQLFEARLSTFSHPTPRKFATRGKLNALRG